MSFVESLTAIALLVDFLLGTVSGVVCGASLAFLREDRRYSLHAMAPDPLCEGARALQSAMAFRDRFAPRGRDDADMDPGEREVWR